MSKLTVFVLLSLLLASGLSWGQPSPSIVADPVFYNAPLYYNHTSHITRTSTDELIVVWSSGSTGGQIVYSTYDPVFQLWSPPAPLSSAGDRADKAGIASDENGNAYVAWQQRNTSAEDYAIYFTKYDGSTWTAPMDLTGSSVENEEVSIAVSDQGRIFVAWNTDAEPDGSEFVLSIYSDDGGQTWSIPPDTLSSSDGLIGGSSTTCGRPFLARGNSGKMVCAWHERPDGHSTEEVFLNQFDGTQWTGEQVVSELTTNETRYPTVAVNSNDMIYAIYSPRYPQRSLVMKKKGWNETNWPAVADTVIEAGYVGYKPFLGIDDNDNLFLVFRRDNAADTTYGLEEVAFVASKDGGATWTDQVRLSRENYDAGYVTLAPRIRPSGVDVLWREAHTQFKDDPDTTAIVYGHIDFAVGVEDPVPVVVKKFQLQQNYPNPFNPSTIIKYAIAKEGFYELTVYNLLGEKIRTLVSEYHLSGSYGIQWNGRNDRGNSIPSGIYFYRLNGNGLNLTQKMILMR
ncbi:hypothetical protein B1H10_05410 [candidate division KSB1 bacterium 4484_188]|nr:MAG: hypothetical protein B1H10_05410 [candidate division KSB1 bacterium 4484_188]